MLSNIYFKEITGNLFAKTNKRSRHNYILNFKNFKSKKR